jgi:hypothetical protein
MPEGGLNVENERKSRLAEDVSRARRRPSVVQTLSQWREETKRKTIMNIARSSQSSRQTGRLPLLGQGLGKLTDNIQQRLLAKAATDEEKETTEEEAAEEETMPEENEQPESRQEEISGELLNRQLQQSRLAEAKMRLAEESGLEEQKKEAAEQIRKRVMSSIRRGVEQLLQGTGNAVDAGTAGCSLLVTIFMYAVTLTDLNLQMIWGYYLSKKKSFFFPALEWDPIPMPKAVPVTILHAGLVILDMIILFLLLLAFTLQIIIMTAPIALASLPALYLFSSDFRSLINNFIFQ